MVQWVPRVNTNVFDTCSAEISWPIYVFKSATWCHSSVRCQKLYNSNISIQGPQGCSCPRPYGSSPKDCNCSIDKSGMPKCRPQLCGPPKYLLLRQLWLFLTLVPRKNLTRSHKPGHNWKNRAGRKIGVLVREYPASTVGNQVGDRFCAVRHEYTNTTNCYFCILLFVVLVRRTGCAPRARARNQKTRKITCIRNWRSPAVSSVAWFSQQNDMMWNIGGPHIILELAIAMLIPVDKQ